MLRVPWVAMVTNAEILRRIGKERELMKIIRQRQLRFLGHVIRENDLERTVVTGRVEGRRDRGRQRTKYMNSLIQDIDGVTTANQLLQMADDREKWRSMIANVKIDTALR